MRMMHDVLPGRIKYIRKTWPYKTMKVTDWRSARTRLNEAELNQYIPDFDGSYDLEYNAIQIPFSKKKIDLELLDRQFVMKFTNYDFYGVLDQLAEVGARKIAFAETDIYIDISNLAAKAICSQGNPWMPEVSCQ